MSGQDAPINPTGDPYQLLQIVRNPDGTITRALDIPETPPTSDPSLSISVHSKDIPINQSNNTWVRIYLPREALDSSSHLKLPLLVYCHGGGFILYSAASSHVHDHCVRLANELRVIIASVEYRLTPEHRLPAAYDDAVEALYRIKTIQDDWLTKYADFSNCFIMGMSAGGNIAYQAGLRVAAEADHLGPLNIRGLILQQPFFGGTQRSESELRLVTDPTLPLCVSDLLWELSLPIGVDRDHEYCNPTVGGGSKLLEKMRLLEWKVLVTGCDGDLLFDRQVELVKLLEEHGVHVVGHFSVGGCHGVDFHDSSRGKVAGRKRRKKIKKPSRTLMRENSQLSSMGCGSFSPNAKQDVFLPKLGYHLRLPTRQQRRLGHYLLIAAQGVNCARSCMERLSARSIGVYQDKDSSREAKCHNSALEEFKPRLPTQQCRQCS